MSERFTMRIPASSGDAFTPGALDGLIGGGILVRRSGGEVLGTVVAAEVIEDGAAASVTVEAPGGTLPGQSLEGYSLSGG